ncbi:hypothetical protein [Clostridium oryzae]|uniref:Uncharacterized protein n=1 Tax=Clostridium oryzae TaxID=1450648 RepID=A0A1V4IRW6_9CLOT|nr:hypothetical protein [Clostridium oryzae]OPJ62560.1 hypothetical protein CLORY_16900 [Clostridium oryzae]
MNIDEKNILFPLIKEIRENDRELWKQLKYETQQGPEFNEYPYYAAAFDYVDRTKKIINGLDEITKKRLVKLWQEEKRVISLDKDEDILDRYAVIVVNEIIRRARVAGNR